MHYKATFAESGGSHPGDRGIELCSLNNSGSIGVNKLVLSHVISVFEDEGIL